MNAKNTLPFTYHLLLSFCDEVRESTFVPIICWSYRAKVVDIVARRLLPADPEKQILRPLVVGAPHPDAHGPVLEQPPEVGLPVLLYRRRV